MQRDSSSFAIARQHIVEANKSIVVYELFNRSQGAQPHSLASDVSMVLNVLAQSCGKLVNGLADLFINDCTAMPYDAKTVWTLLKRVKVSLQTNPRPDPKITTQANGDTRQRICAATKTGKQKAW